jgi:hypothetical protein
MGSPSTFEIKINLERHNILNNTLMKGILCPCGLKKFMGSKLFLPFMITYFYLHMSATSYICLFITSKRFCCKKRRAEKTHAFACDFSFTLRRHAPMHAQPAGPRATSQRMNHLAAGCPRRCTTPTDFFFFFFVPATPTITFFSQLP